MTGQDRTDGDGGVEAAIGRTVRDYYEGWFDGDAARMQRALHPELVKRGFADDRRSIDTDTDTAATMVDDRWQILNALWAPAREGAGSYGGRHRADFPELNRLFADFFPSEPPARMTMQVPLPRGLLISIGCTAVTED